MENYSVQVPPYTVGPEAYKKIEKQCHIYGSKAVVIGGKKAMAAAKEKLLCAVEDTGIEIIDFVWFGGECTFENAEMLEQLEEIRKEKYLEILYSNPAGFLLTARLTTNYRCLRNIYIQRKNHRLPEWREFCKWIETLPYAEELLVN